MAVDFTSAVVGYVTIYSTLLVAAARRMMRSESLRFARPAEKTLRLLLGSLSVKERIAEARAYAAAATIRNAPPGEGLTLQVGPAEDPSDVIELSRSRRRGS